MAGRPTRHRIAALTAVAAAVPLTVILSPAPADAGTRTAVNLDTAAQLVLHDPGDELELPGDTYRANLNAGRATNVARASLSLAPFDCGPHDPAVPPDELGCPEAGPAVEVTLRDVRIRLDGGTAAVAATSDLGALAIRLTGVDPATFVSREWRNAEGTKRSTGRTTTTRYRTATATGTFAGLDAGQPASWLDWAGLTTHATTERRTAGRPVPIRDVPAPGTSDPPWYAVGSVSARWVRPVSGAPGGDGMREFEVGHVAASRGGPYGDLDDYAGVQLRHQRCRPDERLLDQNEQPGPRTCRWSGDPIIAGVEQYTFTLDQRTGNARLDAVLVPLDPAAPKPTVEATWRGGRPIGIHLVETTRFDELATGRTTTTLGIRWPRADAAVTYDGVAKPVDRASVTAYRQRQEPATG